MLREQLEHTADVGIEVNSDSFPEALSEACLALTEIITGGNLVNSSKTITFKISYSDTSHLLVDILNELPTQIYINIKYINIGEYNNPIVHILYWWKN